MWSGTQPGKKEETWTLEKKTGERIRNEQEKKKKIESQGPSGLEQRSPAVKSVVTTEGYVDV